MGRKESGCVYSLANYKWDMAEEGRPQQRHEIHAHGHIRCVCHVLH